MANAAECGQYIETNTVAHPCTLQKNHNGPHMSQDIPVSVRRREKWEKAQGKLEDFHERPQTTAERYTLNPTPVPGEEEADDPAVFIEDTVKGQEPSDDDVDMRVTRSEDFEPRQPVEGVPGHAPQPKQTLGQSPTKQRPGDQVLPTPREDEATQDRILAKARLLFDRGDLDAEKLAIIESTMEQSKQVGVERYGDTLKTYNGRDVLTDIVDEARDLFVYLSQAQQAREEDEERIVNLTIDRIYELNQEGVEITVETIVRESVRFVLDAVTPV